MKKIEELNDAEFMRLMVVARRAQVKQIEERLARERKDCVDFARAYKIGLNADVATPEEKAQLARCPHCVRMVARSSATAEHPSVWNLVRWLAGVMDADDAKKMGWHLKDDACRRCNRLVMSASVRELADVLKTGKFAAERVRALADTAVGMLAPLVGGTGSFAQGETPSHLARQEGPLNVSVRNTAAGELTATVSVLGQDLDGKTVRVELLGEKQTLSDILTLRSQGQAGCGGQVVFGRFDDVAAMLGADYAALVVPVDGFDQLLLR